MSQHIREKAEYHLELAGKSLQILSKSLASQTRLVEKCSSRVSLLEDKVENLQKLYGSQLVWKIDNYNEKFQDAKSGRATTIYSPPFLTSRHGYKMVLSACLNGDGKGRLLRSQLSVRVCLY